VISRFTVATEKLVFDVVMQNRRSNVGIVRERWQGEADNEVETGLSKAVEGLP
jgi:hypothetical protein